MDIGKSFGYMFEDERWLTKVLIGGVVTLIPIVNFATFGYGLRTLKNVSNGVERPLPEWDDFGDFFVKGLLVGVAGLIYLIPVFLLWAMAAIFGTISRYSLGGAETVTGLCTAGIWCLNSIYGLAVALWLPGAIVRYARTDEFGAFFRFGEIWAFITKDLGGYIVAILISWLASLIASIVGGILCGIGVLFTSFWAILVFAHLFGQLAYVPGTGTPAEPPSTTSTTI
jgi:hypothetical protein